MVSAFKIFCKLAASVAVIITGPMVFGSAAYSAETTSPFVGIELIEVEGQFLVSQNNLNVRAKPRTSGARITKLKKGEIVSVIGKAKGGEWYAVRKDGKDLGFAYAPVLLRLLDGRLDEELKGTAKNGNVSCDYTIRFESQNEIEGELMRVADYWSQMECKRNGKKINFSVLMFLTELPYLPNKRGIYQIGVEVADVGVDYDRALSAIAMYNFDKQRVTFDSVSPSQIATKKKIALQSASSVSEALTAAIEMSLKGWNDKFWELMDSR